MKVVFDTNVMVSGLLSPHNAPGQLLYRLAQGELRALYDARMMAEYMDVLHRPDFAIASDIAGKLLLHIEEEGLLIIPHRLPTRLPDLTDEPFLEVAAEGHADALITGNLRHYPTAARHGVNVVSPRDFLDSLKN